MIKMAEKQEIIIRYYREGKSARKISRELGLSRKTVGKYISQYESALAQRQLKGEQVLDACLITPPRYQSGNRSKRCLSEPLQKRLDEYWQQNQQKKQQGLPQTGVAQAGYSPGFTERRLQGRLHNCVQLPAGESKAGSGGFHPSALRAGHEL